MKTVLNAIMKFLAFILAGLLIFVLPLSLLAHNLGEVIFDQEEIGQIAATVFLDSDIIPAALEIITNRQADEISEKIEETDPEDQELDLFTLVYSMEEINWKNFREALFSDQMIQNWIDMTVTGFYNWLNSDEPVPQINWNMKSLKQNMSGLPGEEAVVAFYDSLPDCTDLQMEEMQTEPGDPIPRAKMVEELCKLSTFPHGEQIEVYNDVMQMVVEATPPEYNAARALLKERGEEGGIFTLKWNLRRLRWNMDMALLIPIIMLFLILVFGVRSVEGLGQWWGIPIVGGSIIALITALLYRPLWTGLLTERMPEAIPQTSLLYHELIDGSNRIIAPVFNPLRLQSFFLLLIGVGLLTMGFILRLGVSGKENRQE